MSFFGDVSREETVATAAEGGEESVCFDVAAGAANCGDSGARPTIVGPTALFVRDGARCVGAAGAGENPAEASLASLGVRLRPRGVGGLAGGAGIEEEEAPPVGDAMPISKRAAGPPPLLCIACWGLLP